MSVRWLVHHARTALDPVDALRVSLRLHLVRLLEVQAAAIRAREETDATLAQLSPDDREAQIRAKIRDHAKSSCKIFDSLERIAALPESSTLPAITTYISQFSGALGERLREVATLEALKIAADRSLLRPILKEATALTPNPTLEHEAAFYASEREMLDLLTGSTPAPELLAAYDAYLGREPQQHAATQEVARAGLIVQIDCPRRVSFAYEHNGIPIIQELRLTNTGTSAYEHLHVRLLVGPDFSFAHEVVTERLEPGATFTLKRPDLRLDAARLRQMREREVAGLHLEVWTSSALLLRETQPLDILAFNEWDRTVLPELLAAFVQPNDVATSQVLKLARDHLLKSEESGALSGYQERDRNYVRAMVQAIYDAVQTLGVTYANPPASFESSAQKIRLPSEVLAQTLGTCLDLSVLFASALEQCGLHPLIVLLRDHAFLGVWLIDDWMPVPASDDQDLLRKLVEAGEVLVFDSSTAAKRPKLEFTDSEAVAQGFLEERGRVEATIDIKASRQAKVLPLPMVGEAASLGGDAGSRPSETRKEEARPSQESVENAASRVLATPLHPRVKEWMRRLLDLTARNRLLHFRPSKRKSISFDLEEVDLFEQRLAHGDALSLEPAVPVVAHDPRAAELQETRGAAAHAKTFRLELLARGLLITRHESEELLERAKILLREARTELAETGKSTLYLALGFLRWFEVDQKNVERRAPILLYPVEITRASVQSRYRIVCKDDDPRLNEALVEKLRLDFEIDLTSLRDLPLADEGVDLPLILETVRRATARCSGFDVLNEAHLAFFPFAKFVIWDDLRDFGDTLFKNRFVERLVVGATSNAEPHSFRDPSSLDREVPLAASHLVVDADSSQHVAIDAAVQGGTFVLQGPPGTGKSQTITNLIASALARGQRVLFVAEKRAALEVVAKRLERAGLRDLVLELHSNKSKKREVIDELTRVLDLGASSDDVQVETTTLEQERDRLNAYSHALHTELALGHSAYSAAARLKALASMPALAMDFRDPLKTSSADHTRRLAVLSNLADAATPLRPLLSHPLRALRLREWSPLRERDWRTLLGNYRDAARAHAPQMREVGTSLGVSARALLHHPNACAELLNLSEDVPLGAQLLVEAPDASAVLRRLESILELAKEREAQITVFSPRFHERLQDLDLDALLGAYNTQRHRFFILRYFGLRGANGILASVAKHKVPSSDQVITDLESAIAARSATRKIEKESDLLARFLGTHARGATTDFELVSKLCVWGRRFLAARESLNALDPGALSAVPKNAAPSDLAKRFLTTQAALHEAADKAHQALGIQRTEAWESDVFAEEPEAVEAATTQWLKHLDQARAYSRFVHAEDEVLRSDLVEVSQALRRDALSPDAAAATYERAFLGQWMDHVIDASESLRSVNGRDHDRTVDRFREGDALFIKLGGARVAKKAGARRPARAVDDIAGSEVAILRREARKKTRHKAIRALFSEISALLPRLKPCLLMSPMSIAQYLATPVNTFDLVIFDEASQIPTHDAIGAIARGRQVIVVGDSRQLPPTNFFVRTLGADEEEAMSEVHQVEELESILDECVATGVPEIMLKWHYRSRHEALIAFSNAHYYQGGLQSFPTPEKRSSDVGVFLHRIEGPYDGSKTRTNAAEAHAIVAWIVEALLDPMRQTRSIGVVTFNQPQQTLIEDQLDLACSKHPEIEVYLSDSAPEPVFVKNLENVQGDERDIMLFSITYGPDENDRVRMNFGPLNLDGGERRLNVAVTRAREQLHVFATLRPERIDLTKSRARGVADLKAFLRYAEEGPGSLHATSTNKPKTSITALEHDIAHRLRARGHIVDLEIGVSGYRLDLAIRHPKAQERYVLGIETDGKTYESAATARDRDRLRAHALRNLGWSLHRVWSVDYWHNPDAEITRIEDALTAAQEAPSPPRALGANATLLTSPPPNSAAPTSAPPASPPVPSSDDSSTPTVRAPLFPSYSTPVPTSLGTLEDFESAASTPRIHSFLAAVIQGESPIHIHLLQRRVLDAFSISRAGTRIAARLEQLFIDFDRRAEAHRVGDFYWASASDPATFDRPRGPDAEGEARDIDHVAEEELAAGLLLTLDRAVAAPKEKLMARAAALFGYRRFTPRVREVFLRALKRLLADGRIQERGEDVHAP